MAIGEVQEQQMKKYVDIFQDLDDRREGLDFEIQELLEEIDTQPAYDDDTNPQADAETPFASDSKVGTLIDKMIER